MVVVLLVRYWGGLASGWRAAGCSLRREGAGGPGLRMPSAWLPGRRDAGAQSGRSRQCARGVGAERLGRPAAPLVDGSAHALAAAAAARPSGTAVRIRRRGTAARGPCDLR